MAIERDIIAGSGAPDTGRPASAIGPSAATRRAIAVIIGLAVFLVLTVCVSLMLGRYPIEPLQALAMLVDQIPGISIEQFWTDQQATLFFNVRLPRIVLAIMVGCCLATAGAAFQGTFQNPLVSPDILGASQGAAFGAAIAILAGSAAFGVSVSAFAFSIATVLLVLLVSSRAKGNRILVTVLAGAMISSLFSAGCPLHQARRGPHRRSARHHLLADGEASRVPRCPTSCSPPSPWRSA